MDKPDGSQRVVPVTEQPSYPDVVEVDEKAMMAAITEEVVADAMALRRRVFDALFPLERESGLVSHAQRELALLGDIDCDDWAKECVLDLMRVFSTQGHSEGSAGLVLHMFLRLASYSTLSPITDDPETWMHVAEEVAGSDPPVWQSKRRPDAFSNDGGKTWYYLNEAQTSDAEGVMILHRMAPRDAGQPDTEPAWVHEYSSDNGETWYPETGNTASTG